MKAQNTDRTERIGVATAMSTFESIGFAFREQAISDYGIDAHAELIRSEKPTGQLLGIQLKSGASFFTEATSDGYVFRADAKHVDYWLNHALPVVICLCDVDRRTIYWQVVNSTTAAATGKGYKLTVPYAQKIDAGSRGALEALLTPVVATDRFTIFNLEDVSHGAAKRYSIKVVLNGSLSKAEVAAVIRQVTSEGQKRQYYRSDMVEGRWGATEAHVVWTFVYPSAEDHARYNHVCRSSWINEDLEPRFRPVGLEGENVGDNIIVDWSENYSFLGTHVAQNTLSKEDYLSRVRPVLAELKQLLSKLDEGLTALDRGTIDESAFIKANESALNRVNTLYTELTDLAFAPYECRDMDSKLQSFASSLDNIWLHFSDLGRGTWDAKTRLYLSRSQMSDAKTTLPHLEYELSKVR